MMRLSMPIVCCLCLWSPVAVGQEVSPPVLETYLSSRDVSGYVTAAQVFLDTYGASKHAPRVALDLILVAERMRDTSLLEKAQGRLLFSYPESIQAYHVMAGFKEAADFRKFLVAQLNDRVINDSKKLAERFAALFGPAANYYKQKLIDDGQFLLMAYCLSDVSGNEKLCQGILPAMMAKAGQDAKMGPVAGICMDTQRSLVDKVHLLNGFDNSYSQFPMKLYLSLLSNEQKQDPRILRIRLLTAMGTDKFQQALELYEQLPASIQTNAQIQFLRAWALVATGVDAQAIDILNGLVKDFPQSEWAEISPTYVAGLQRFEQVKEAQAQALLALAETFRKDLALFQATVEFTPKQGEAFTIHVGSNSELNFFECAIEKNGVMVVAYRTTRDRAAFFLPDETEILMWPKAGPLPMPNLTLERMSDGTFLSQVNLGMEATLAQAGKKGLQILNSPYLSTLDGINSLLEYATRRHGRVPMEPKTLGKHHVEHGWFSPKLKEARLLSLTWTLTPEHRLYGLEAGPVKVTSIRYGASNSFELNLPPWPERPKRLLEKNDPALIIKIAGTVMELFKS